MTTKEVGVAIGGLIVGALLLLAFQIIFPPPPPPPPSVGAYACGRAICVDVNVIMVNEQAVIQAIPDIPVPAKSDIRWLIKTTGYTFASAGGIDFANPGGTNPPKMPAPSGEVVCTLNSSTEIQCHDNHGHLGKYAYKVTLGGNPPVTPLDPFIINR